MLVEVHCLALGYFTVEIAVNGHPWTISAIKSVTFRLQNVSLITRPPFWRFLVSH